MPAVEATPVSSSESGLIKMEDRKRPAVHDQNDAAPPSKRQATSVNGNKPHPDADMPWKDDLERFTKDAIWRQMQEFKREKVTLESKVKEMTKAATYHQDHLRIIDAWFKQLIDEVRILFGDNNVNGKDHAPFQTSLLFEDDENFQKHLKNRSSDIKDTVSKLIAKAPQATQELSELQRQLSKKLAEEKVTIVELEKALSERQQFEEQLEAASLRYMMAEKKLDRARSMTVAKLEKQYILGAQRPGGDGPSSATREDTATPVNGATPSPEKNADLEEAYNKTLALSQKQREQLDTLEAENAKLTSEITALNIKNSKLTDDDYAHTDLFKQLKLQYEDVIKRVNHLEALNVQLREEAGKLQAERAAYRNNLDAEKQKEIEEKDAQLQKAESDLARIRSTRDELLADQQMRKATQEQESTAASKAQELAAAREAQIESLESEVERLRIRVDGLKDGNAEHIEGLSVEDLRIKYLNLDRQYAMLNKELTSMQTVCKKYSSLASQKVADISALEEKAQRLAAEKSKADQKYFAVMKSKEVRDAEVRTLRLQNLKSSDIISQLKDAETATRSLVANLEKQIAEGKEALTSVSNKYRASQQQNTENILTIDGLKAQVAELKSLMSAKDSTLASTSAACRKAEAEVESLKSTLSDTKKSLENWKTKSLGNSSSEYEMLRTLALCTVCRRNFKNTAIKTCGHVFCKDCVEERQTSRSRKCPNCNKSFGSNDYMHVTL
ncbi:histone ubiquitinationc protein (Bre1), putative [Talaromyces stipitatus ATCC 10500]|uniref:E3 ubiquitin protein ligase n=1 Tax=Talaromyces stipitatus (strain ATCC 10500 / CBS 375.48 / QM 6759 / NRRL 1006) TaxID=441959 RepID=B8MSP0_TALSN|nr:histone ubiquitinationc protein (Bre1), putative [Talaromyces stipitatus ATCC 10500]EED12477.1 histone ubiquitinationc protein (Bre1), putative [Talaromyces stipitatus ATCC 10500]